MTGIVRELQKEALDNATRISDLLRKALLVARKLKVTNIEQWILHELSGYGESTVPPYRVLPGQVKSWNPYTGLWMPIMFPGADPAIYRSLTHRNCGQPISEIEALLTKARDGELAMEFSPKVQDQIMRGTDMSFPPVLLVQEAKLHGIVDAVRTTVLEWALELEAKGIAGDDLTFSDDDRRIASHITFNIGNMSHSQIQADTTHSQQIVVTSAVDLSQLLGFVAKTRAAVDSLKLSPSDQAELQAELSTLEAQAKSSKPKPTIVQESARSVRAILEHAGGHTVAAGLLQALKILFGG